MHSFSHFVLDWPEIEIISLMCACMHVQEASDLFKSGASDDMIYRYVIRLIIVLSFHSY